MATVVSARKNDHIKKLSQQNSGCGPGLLLNPEMHNNSSISNYNVSIGTVMLSKETI